MYDLFVDQFYVKLNSFLVSDLSSLEGFEGRLSSLRMHKDIVKMITITVYSIDDGQDRERVDILMKKARDEITDLRRTLRGFHKDMSFPQNMNFDEEGLLIDDEEKAVLKKMQDINQSSFLKLSAPKKTADQLNKIFQQIDCEKNLLSNLEKSIAIFRQRIEDQKMELADEDKILSSMLFSLNKKDFVSLRRDAEKLRQSQLKLDNLIKDEKVFIHLPLEKLYGQVSGAEMSAKKIIDDRKGLRGIISSIFNVNSKVTIEDIKKDVRSFAKVSEFMLYKKKLLETGVLPKTASDFLQRLDEQALVEQLENEHSTARSMVDIEPLTQVGSRRFFFRKLEEFIKHHRDGDVLSLLIIDLDFFKKFNDSFGHQAGDKMLNAVAGMMRDYFRRNDEIVARYGGEEFVVILPRMNNDAAVRSAGILKEKVKAESVKLGYGPITLSIGVASLSELKSKDMGALVKMADDRLYDAKRMGRDCVIGANLAIDKGYNEMLLKHPDSDNL